ncbi:NAD-dependent epimerase/dehydratase family protein [bacterium]|nr:NAD-dependent epimerase/dehydratase family protein [bacterium]
MKKYDHVVTITGASGFVGSNLARYFIESEEDVRVFGTDLSYSDRLDDIVDHEDFTFEEYNANQPVHSDLLAVDTFYHFAGIANPERYLKEPITVLDLNIDSLRNILERISRWDAHKPRIVYSSTSEVYGCNPDVPFVEDQSKLIYGPTKNRRWCYAMTKAIGEHYIQSYADEHDIAYTIFRFFNLVGNDVDAPGAGRVITRMVGDAMKYGVINVTYPGTQTRCFTYTDDFVRCLALPTFLKKTREGFRDENHILNLGSDEEMDMLTLAYRIKAIVSNMTGQEPQVKIVEPEVLFGAKGYEDIPRRVPDVSKVNAEFGWSAETTIDEFLPTIVNAVIEKHGS